LATLDQLLDSDRTQEISRQAAQVDVGRVLLTLIAAVFFSIGWIAGKALLAVVWCAVAMKVGYVEARHGARKPAGRRGSA
jgi:uncharacterized membrane protein